MEHEPNTLFFIAIHSETVQKFYQIICHQLYHFVITFWGLYYTTVLWLALPIFSIKSCVSYYQLHIFLSATMWKVKLWNLSQCLIGSFPYLLSYNKGFIISEVYIISFFFSFTELYLCYKTFNDVCVFYKNPGSEPQLFGCYGVLATTAILILHRTIMFLRTKRLLNTILCQLPCPSRYFTISTYLAFFEVLLMVMRLTFLMLLNPILRQLSIIKVVTTSYLILITPLLIQSQFILVCSFVQSGFSNLQVILRRETVVDGMELRKIRKRLCKLEEFFEWALTVFQVDLLLSVGLVVISILLSMNDLTLTIFKAYEKNVQLVNYVLRLLYFLLFDLGEAVYAVWLVNTAMEMLKSVSNTSAILYKQNTDVMDRSAKEEMILLLEHLSGCQLNMNVCGFFTIHPRSLFKTFSTVLTLFILFIQLFQQRYA